MATSLDLKAIGKRPLGYARGEAQVERYVFRVGLHPAAEGPTFPFVFEAVTGFELSDSFSLDALIGMDILSQCDFNMTRDGRWSLLFG